MVAIALALVRLRDLFSVAMLFSIFSLLAAALYVVQDAVDVAFTEAAVGAGISTVLILATLALTTGEEKAPPRRAFGALMVVIVTGAALIYGTFDMPLYGDPSAPIHQHVVPRYIERSGVEIGVPNIVTSVLASYRGYDTLGEVTVIFTAAAGVLTLLGRRRGRIGIVDALQARLDIQQDGPLPRSVLAPKAILRVVSKLLMPLILLFALYVQFHGDFGPGGGFQAGVIFGSVFILYALIFGARNARQVIPAAARRAGLAAGLLLYALVGVAGLLMGGRYLNYSVLAREPIHGQHLGIALIEFGVGTTVAAAMIIIFFVFSGQDR
ncbi:MAG: DUF4040 domain-containing protein [Rhodospirillales bacterium]|jgi:multicomponent Na+:H+ antiporter subunit B|nr:DUF4040 domain-containing protein [Rhodospirillales bacterium]HJO72916.1 DUF4040 domain-containing protein [Rhodospirillales bacterium]